MSLVFGLLVRPASICGAIYLLALLFSSNYPGPKAPFGGYLGASLDHSVFALWFTAFIIGQSDARRSIQPHLRHWMRASG